MGFVSYTQVQSIDRVKTITITIIIIIIIIIRLSLAFCDSWVIMKALKLPLWKTYFAIWTR